MRCSAGVASVIITFTFSRPAGGKRDTWWSRAQGSCRTSLGWDNPHVAFFRGQTARSVRVQTCGQSRCLGFQQDAHSPLYAVVLVFLVFKDFPPSRRSVYHRLHSGARLSFSRCFTDPVCAHSEKNLRRLIISAPSLHCYFPPRSSFEWPVIYVRPGVRTGGGEHLDFRGK